MSGRTVDCGGWGGKYLQPARMWITALVTISPFTPQPRHHYLPHLVTWPRWPASADCETVVNWAATDISRIESNNQGREGENFPLPLAADRCIVTCCVRCCQNTHHITSHNTEHGTQGSRQGQCDGFCIVGLCCGMESG